jgi:hypothetical protein
VTNNYQKKATENQATDGAFINVVFDVILRSCSVNSVRFSRIAKNLVMVNDEHSLLEL